MFQMSEFESEGQAAGGSFIFQRTGAGEFGRRAKDPRNDHGDHQIPVTAAAGGDDLVEVELFECAEHHGNMSMRQGAKDLPRLAVEGRGQIAAQAATNDLDEVVREVGNVAEGLVQDLAIFAKGAAQAVGAVGLAVVRACCSGCVG